MPFEWVLLLFVFGVPFTVQLDCGLGPPIASQNESRKVAMNDPRLNEGPTPPHVHPDSAGLQFIHSSHSLSSSQGIAQENQRPSASQPDSTGPEVVHLSVPSHGSPPTYQQSLNPHLISAAQAPPTQATATTTALGPGSAAPNDNTTPEKQKSRRRIVLWTLVLVVTVLIFAAIAGGVAAKYILANKKSYQELASNTGNTEPTSGTLPTTEAITANHDTSSSTKVTTTPSIVTATITSAPTSTATNPCANTRDFTSTVLWAGVSSPITPWQGIWIYDLANGQACCESCWNLSPQRCNVWGFFPLGHPMGDRVSCAVVYDYPGSQVDITCPAGRPQVGILPAGSDDPYDASGNVAGPGPCAGPIYSASQR